MMLMCFLCFFFFFPFFFILSWNNIDNMSILEALCWIWQSHIWNKLLLRSLIFLSFRKTTWRVLPVRNILLLSLFVFLGLFLNLYWGIMDRKKLYIVHMFWWIWAYSYIKHNTRSFPSGSVVKNLPATQELQDMWVQTLGQEDPLEKGMATRSSIPAWRIPWTEEPGGLQSMGLQRVGHDWSKSAQELATVAGVVSSMSTGPQDVRASEVWKTNSRE